MSSTSRRGDTTMLVNRLDSPFRPSHHNQWSHQQNRSVVRIAAGVRRGSRTRSAVSRCKQRKLQTITRQHTAAPVTRVQTLPCDPINSFNGEWSVLLTREGRKGSVITAAGRLKKKKNTHSTAATGNSAVSQSHFSTSFVAQFGFTSDYLRVLPSRVGVGCHRCFWPGLKDPQLHPRPSLLTRRCS